MKPPSAPRKALPSEGSARRVVAIASVSAVDARRFGNPWYDPLFTRKVAGLVGIPTG